MCHNFGKLVQVFVLFSRHLNSAVLPSYKKKKNTKELLSKLIADGDRPPNHGNGDRKLLKQTLQKALMILTES